MNHELPAASGLAVGTRRYALDRMADPGQPVTLIERIGDAGSRWVVRAADGSEFVVASERLSTLPAGAFYRSLRAEWGPGAREPATWTRGPSAPI